MLAEVRDAPSAKKVMDLAAAAEVYARKAKLGADAVQYAAGIKLDAERKLGQYLQKQPKAPAGRPKEIGSGSEPISERPATIAELGISKKLSAEAQRLASIPDDTFARVKLGEIRPNVALRDQKRAELGDKIRALPPGKFRVVYADPPWKYGDERGGTDVFGGGGTRSDSAAIDKYPTMPTEKICDFTDENKRHVSDLAYPDAVLFMWATFPLLEDALRVVTAWKFDYKTALVWHKQRSNVGNYHDASCELLLICTRGSCAIEIDTRVCQLQSIARTEHSRKPDEFRALVDKLYPSGPRVELFRRGVAPAGWTIWGNEAKQEAA